MVTPTPPYKAEIVKSEANLVYNDMDVSWGKETNRLKPQDSTFKDDTRYHFALESIRSSPTPPKTGALDTLLRALGLRRWVILQVELNKSEGVEKCYVKVNAESLRKRLGVDKEEFYKTHKGVDYTEFTQRKIQQNLDDSRIIQQLQVNFGTGKEVFLSNNGKDGYIPILKEISKDQKTFTLEHHGEPIVLTRAEFLSEFRAGREVSSRVERLLHPDKWISEMRNKINQEGPKTILFSEDGITSYPLILSVGKERVEFPEITGEPFIVRKNESEPGKIISSKDLLLGIQKAEQAKNKAPIKPPLI